MHRDWWLPLANLQLNFDFLDLTGTHWRGALRERFVGHVPPLQRRTGGVLLENVLWDTCPPAAVAVGFDSLSCGDSCSPHRSGPMNVAAGLDYGISFSDHIRSSLEGVRASHFLRVYRLLPGGRDAP